MWKPIWLAIGTLCMYFSYVVYGWKVVMYDFIFLNCLLCLGDSEFVCFRVFGFEFFVGSDLCSVVFYKCDSALHDLGVYKKLGMQLASDNAVLWRRDVTAKFRR